MVVRALKKIKLSGVIIFLEEGMHGTQGGDGRVSQSRREEKSSSP